MLCTTTKARDVMETLSIALEASVFDSMKATHRARLRCNNGSNYIGFDRRTGLRKGAWIRFAGAHCTSDTGQYRAFDTKRPITGFLLENYYLPGDLAYRTISSRGSATCSPTTPISAITSASLRDARRSLLRTRSDKPAGRRKDQRDALRSNRLQHHGKFA